MLKVAYLNKSVNFQRRELKLGALERCWCPLQLLILGACRKNDPFRRCVSKTRFSVEKDKKIAYFRWKIKIFKTHHFFSLWKKNFWKKNEKNFFRTSSAKCSREHFAYHVLTPHLLYISIYKKGANISQTMSGTSYAKCSRIFRRPCP